MSLQELKEIIKIQSFKIIFGDYCIETPCEETKILQATDSLQMIEIFKRHQECYLQFLTLECR